MGRQRMVLCRARASRGRNRLMQLFMGSMRSYWVSLGFAALGWVGLAPHALQPVSLAAATAVVQAAEQAPSDAALDGSEADAPDAGGASTSPSAPQLKEIGGVGSCANHHEHGPWTCNCTGGPVNVQICEGKSIKVNFGGKVIRAETGVSSTSCVTTTASPGACVAMRYNYLCCIKVGWLFDTVSCKYLGKSVVERPAGPGEC
jgi:hypothetical protein